MSVWGKVSGAAAGLLVGGPVGALVGAVAGHFIFDRETDPGVAFTIAVIALAGKMAKADGIATEEEFAIFLKVFSVPAQEEGNVRRVFNLARQDVAGEDEIRQTYRRLVRENHPDSLIARGVPEEFIKLANDKLAAINGAYEKIQLERGLK